MGNLYLDLKKEMIYKWLFYGLCFLWVWPMDAWLYVVLVYTGFAWGAKSWYTYWNNPFRDRKRITRHMLHVFAYEVVFVISDKTIWQIVWDNKIILYKRLPLKKSFRGTIRSIKDIIQAKYRLFRNRLIHPHCLITPVTTD